MNKKKTSIKEKAKQETVEWVKALIYAVIAVVIIRLFVFETMMVPTESMVPTIIPQDRLFVERITYQAREPEYGEVVVFWTPFVDKEAQKMLRAFDHFMDMFSPKEFQGHVKYVKRLIGKPGDVVELSQNIGGSGYRVVINGQTPDLLKDINYERAAIFTDPNFYRKMAFPKEYPYLSAQEKNLFNYYNEALDYEIAYEEVFGKLEVEEYAWYDKDSGKVKIKVPDGLYFFMGDNSAHSFDGRYFGFVPEKNIVGGPLLIFWPLNHFGPINKDVKPNGG